MPQIRAKMPDGTVQSFANLDEAWAESRRMKAEQDKPKPWMGKAVDAILSAAPIPEGTKEGLLAARRELSDPENISSLGGAAGGILGGAAGGALVGGPVGAIGGGILGAFAGGTAASKYGEGKELGPAMKEGAGEAAFEGLGGAPLALAGRYMAAPAARALTGYALRPDRSVMDALIDPATGKQFPTPGDAARHFRTEATRMMDDIPGVPGGTTYANAMIGLDEADRAAKVRLMEASHARVPTEDLVPPGALDKMVAEMAQRSGSAPTDVGDVERAVSQSLSRSHPVMPTPPGQRVPNLQSIPEDVPWTLPEIDQRVGGLQDDLNDLFAARQKAQMLGDTAPAKSGELAKNIVRKHMSRAIATAEPEIAPLNQAISRRIPFTGAAIDATMPVWGDAVPRIRIAGSPTNPNVSLFDYIRKGAGVAARPAHVASKVMQSPLSRQLSPQLLRVLQAIMSGEQR